MPHVAHGLLFANPHSICEMPHFLPVTGLFIELLSNVTNQHKSTNEIIFAHTALQPPRKQNIPSALYCMYFYGYSLSEINIL